MSSTMALEKGIAELVEGLSLRVAPHRANKVLRSAERLYRQRCPCG